MADEIIEKLKSLSAGGDPSSLDDIYMSIDAIDGEKQIKEVFEKSLVPSLQTLKEADLEKSNWSDLETIYSHQAFSVLSVLARLCRKEEARAVADEFQMHVFLSQHAKKLIDELIEGGVGASTKTDFLCVLLRSIANLAYDNEPVQTNLQFLRQPLINLITQDALPWETFGIGCGALQNLIIEPEEDEQNPQPMKIDLDLAFIDQVIMKMDRAQRKDSVSESEEENISRGLSLLLRMSNFKNVRDKLFTQNESCSWYSLQLKNNDENVDLVEDLLAGLECALMEDNMGHVTIFETAFDYIVPFFKSNDENILTRACNVLVGLVMEKGVVSKLMNDGRLSTALETLGANSSPYAQASMSLILGNLAFDNESAKINFKPELMNKYVIPKLIEPEANIIERSAALVALKNYLVCPETKVKLSSDERIFQSLCRIFTTAELPNQSKDLFQSCQNIRLISNSDPVKCRDLAQNSDLISRLLKTASEVPVDYIMSECNRLICVICTHGLSGDVKVECSLLEQCLKISIVNMLEHASYIMQNEGSIALGMVLTHLELIKMKGALEFPLNPDVVESLKGSLFAILKKKPGNHDAFLSLQSKSIRACISLSTLISKSEVSKSWYDSIGSEILTDECKHLSEQDITKEDLECLKKFVALNKK